MNHSPARKTLVLDSTIFDLQPDGGISRYWCELVGNLASRHEEWSLRLLADPDTSNKFGKKLISVTKDRPNVQVDAYIPSQFGRFFGPRLPAEYRTFLWHSSYYRVPTGSRVSAVCTVHDFIYERYFSGTHALLHNWKKRRAILGAKEIICVSEATKRDLLTFYPNIDDSKCHVIYHGRSSAFRPAARPGSVEAPERYVLFVGNRASYKNFRLAVLAIEALPDHQLFIVGGGKLSNYELKLLREHLAGRHRIFESPTDEILCGLYQNATALAYLSRCEGFGFPPLEAMACGCPVVAMRSSSIPEVVADAGILLSSENLTGVTDAIRAAATFEPRMSMIEKGIKRAAQFSWDRAVDETAEVYEQAIR